MAYNRCRLSLCGASWEPYVIQAEMVGLQKRAEPFGMRWMVADVEVVRRWLVQMGFQATSMWHLFQRGAVMTELGSAPELEVQLGRSGSELVEAVLTFTLTPNAENWWADWGRLIGEMCCQFGLSVIDPDGWQTVSSAEALAVLSRTAEWRWYADEFGWAAMC